MAKRPSRNTTTERLPELKRFDYTLVSARLDGLLFNIDRDLERSIRAAIERMDAEGERCLSLIHLLFRFARNSYQAILYLTADTPAEPKRKPEYVLVAPAINRQILDLLFSLTYMLDDLPSRSAAYQKAAFRELKEELHRLSTDYASAPEWQAHLDSLKRICSNLANRYSISEAEQADPQLIRYWKSPYELKEEKTKSRPFLRHLHKWLYSDTSAQAHLSFAGLIKGVPVLMSDLIQTTSHKSSLERFMQQYRFHMVSRTAFIVLAIATEIDKHYSLGNRSTIEYLWTIFSEFVPEAKEIRTQRYGSLYEL